MGRWMAVVALVAAGAGGAAAEEADPLADYPPQAVREYVDGCNAANGDTAEARSRCACSIDVVTTLLPYARYETAATFLSIGQVPGERGAMLRTSRQAKEAIDDLRRAQMEAELRCF